MVAKGTTTTKAADTKPSAAKTGTVATVTADVKADAVAAAHDAVAEANARKADQDAKSAAEAKEQFAKAAAQVADDEAAKVRADDAPGGPSGAIALPDVDPRTPLSQDEQAAIQTARQTIAQTADPNAPVLTKDAEKRIAAAEKLPPIAEQAPIATPGASATNPALARNDVDVTKTPPFGAGNRADLRSIG